MDDFFERLKVRFGYGLYFFDRQKLLEIFYDKLEHKERVLTQKKVTDVNLVKGGVEAICADGSVFTGTFLVGADGIHSAVRESMTELGHKLQPGYFDPSEKDRVPCYYRCSFGIAQHVPNWVPNEQHLVFGTGCSQLVISGPDDKVYWFLFEQLPEVKYGKDIPKYTKEDEAEFVKHNRDVPLTTEITWGDVYNARISSALTALHEVVYEKWFFNRIITLGDSCHKVSPRPISTLFAIFLSD
jgi:2-polyprenyl-6-methoxyphenol hydroxylase-like FAD-dependent oxidoreductase